MSKSLAFCLLKGEIPFFFFSEILTYAKISNIISFTWYCLTIKIILKKIIGLYNKFEIPCLEKIDPLMIRQLDEGLT